MAPTLTSAITRALQSAIAKVAAGQDLPHWIERAQAHCSKLAEAGEDVLAAAYRRELFAARLESSETVYIVSLPARPWTCNVETVEEAAERLGRDGQSRHVSRAQVSVGAILGDQHCLSEDERLRFLEACRRLEDEPEAGTVGDAELAARVGALREVGIR